MSKKVYMTEKELEKALLVTPQIIIDALPDKPEEILKYITRLETPNFSPNITPELKEKMLNHLLDNKDYISTFLSILATFFDGKNPTKNPKLHLILGQTGSGKSNLTAKILRENENTVIIDSDKYKHYRPDAEMLAKKDPTLYGFLTGPDAYGHRDNVYDYAVDKKYNILIEIAPSMKNGLFNINIDDLIEKGYTIDAHVLAVSKLNSALSVHERYEGQIEAELPTPKLTDLARHNESFEALNNCVKDLQNNKKMNMAVYKRAKKHFLMPELVFPKEGTNKYSCPYQALIEAQQLDYKNTIKEFKDRYSIILEQMEKRNAPREQYGQLEKIKEMYNGEKVYNK